MKSWSRIEAAGPLHNKLQTRCQPRSSPECTSINCDRRIAIEVDHAETANIGKLISRIGAGLDQFLKFEHEDCWHSESQWRDRQLLYRAFTQEPADYLEDAIKQETEAAPRIEHSMDDFGVPYYDYGVELSAPCRGVVVWAMIREIGVVGMTQRVKRHNDMAGYIAMAAKEHPHLELLLEPTLSICCFRYVAPGIDDLDSFNRQLHRSLVRENQNMPSTTQVNGKLALRPCFVGARTNQAHAEALLKDALCIGQDLAREFK